jgi:hypothetical protein
MIEGHQGRTAPFLTRDPGAGADYGSICSIYTVRFAISGAAVALLTRNQSWVFGDWDLHQIRDRAVKLVVDCS